MAKSYYKTTEEETFPCKTGHFRKLHQIYKSIICESHISITLSPCSPFQYFKVIFRPKVSCFLVQRVILITFPWTFQYCLDVSKQVKTWLVLPEHSVLLHLAADPYLGASFSSKSRRCQKMNILCIIPSYNIDAWLCCVWKPSGFCTVCTLYAPLIICTLCWNVHWPIKHQSTSLIKYPSRVFQVTLICALSMIN